jgi:hypothetical protein
MCRMQGGSTWKTFSSDIRSQGHVPAVHFNIDIYLMSLKPADGHLQDNSHELSRHGFLGVRIFS